jgi:predicted nuclease of predicted toxin-antitoxin system
MRILLDACLPERLRLDLASAGDVESAKFAELDHQSNGQLLQAMVGRFDVLVTIDKSMPHEQTIGGRPIAIVVIRSVENRIRALKPVMPQVATAISQIKPGEIIDV